MNPTNQINQATEQKKQKNFINLSASLKAKILDNLRNALDVISNTPSIQAQAFAVHGESRTPRPRTIGNQPVEPSLEEQTAGLCVIAFGPLAILLMAQINAMPELYNQLQVMHMRELQSSNEASSSSESGDSIITPGSSLII